MNVLSISLRTLLAPLGGLALLLGERIVPGTPVSPYLDALGVLLVVGALAREGRELLRPGSVTPISLGRQGTILPHALFVLSLGLYFAGQSIAKAQKGGMDWAALADWGWVLCLSAGTVLFVFLELARLAQRRLPTVDHRRMGFAAEAGVFLALLLLLLVILNFIFSQLPWEWNVAYFNTTQASEATREVVGELTEPVEAGVFFSPDSPIAPLMRGYFDTLTGQGTGDGTGDGAEARNFEVHFADADLNPSLAETFKARGNGWVILRKGEITANIFVGETIKRAKGVLRKFDETFFGKLLEVSQKRKTAFLTVGHGERNERSTVDTGATAARDKDRAFNRFQTLLRGRNFEIKTLGISTGLGVKIPDQAAVVIIAGPSEPFLPAELESLDQYLEKGGSLLVFLEPETSGKGRNDPASFAQGGANSPGNQAGAESLLELLASHGIRYRPVMQANDRIYGRRTYTKADRTLLVTVRYQAHPSVNVLRRVANQFPLLFLGAGALEKSLPKAGMKVEEIIKGMPGTWGDRNRNFLFDAPGEKRGEPVLAMAVSPVAPKLKNSGKGTPATGPKILVFSDTDLASDLLLQNRANRVLAEASLNWLSSPGLATGKYPANEEDVKIIHAKGDDWLWFYLPVIGIPALILGIGFWRIGRRRKRSGSAHE